MPENIQLNKERSAELAAMQNGDLIIGERQGDFGVKPTAIYFYNVGSLDHSQPRYPNHPHMYIRGCPKGESYVMARGSIEHPFFETRYDQNEVRFQVPTNGFKEATRMLNPQNPCLKGDESDLDWAGQSEFHLDDDLTAFGVFWSTHNPPLESEVQRAKSKMEAKYRKELERMSKAKTSDEAMTMRNRISIAAADYYNVDATWHQTNLVSKDHGKTDCWACGEKIQPRALICVHCRAPQAENKRDAWLDAQTTPNLPARKTA